MILLLDNFDSFTYNLVDYFNQLKIGCHVVRNDVSLEEISRYKFDGIVLSPGPEIPEKAGNLMAVLSHYHKKLPILGICLGHQAIGQFFGAQVQRAVKPMHGKLSRIKLEKDVIFTGIPSEINVVRYNSLVVKGGGDELQILARCENNEVMALRHRDLRLWGVQFHPEAALTEHGLNILKNWLSCNKIAI